MNVYEEMMESIKEKGWIKGEVGSNEKGYCMMGHLMHCTSALFQPKPEVSFIDAEDILVDIIKEQFPERIQSGINDHLTDVARFNDHPATTIDEVIIILEKASVNYGE